MNYINLPYVEFVLQLLELVSDHPVRISTVEPFFIVFSLRFPWRRRRDRAVCWSLDSHQFETTASEWHAEDTDSSADLGLRKQFFFWAQAVLTTW